MLQRIQSIWLLLAAVFAFLTFELPFYQGGNIIQEGTVTTAIQSTKITAQSTIGLTILAALIGAMAFINIFFFNNRKVQLRLCVFGMALTIIFLALSFMQITRFTNGSLALSCIIYFAIFAFYILAARGIWKDEKLIKNMDRLR